MGQCSLTNHERGCGKRILTIAVIKSSTLDPVNKTGGTVAINSSLPFHGG